MGSLPFQAGEPGIRALGRDDGLALDLVADDGRLVVAFDGFNGGVDALLGLERPLVHAADAVAGKREGGTDAERGEDAVERAHFSVRRCVETKRRTLLPTVSTSSPQP